MPTHSNNARFETCFVTTLSPSLFDEVLISPPCKFAIYTDFHAIREHHRPDRLVRLSVADLYAQRVRETMQPDGLFRRVEIRPWVAVDRDTPYRQGLGVP